MNFIDTEQLKTLAKPLCKNDYGKYLMALAEGKL
jgi:glucose-1-phosphate thymidylyltransferase